VLVGEGLAVAGQVVDPSGEGRAAELFELLAEVAAGLVAERVTFSAQLPDLGAG
jgi:hypothetical protein